MANRLRRSLATWNVVAQQIMVTRWNLAETGRLQTEALSGQREESGRYLSRIREVSPGRDACDFLAVFRFRRQRDEQRISRAFDDMRRYAA